jgi:chloride channel protein, CIC family
MIAKLIMTPVSIGGGFAGGVFAPALFIGAMLGGGLGLIAQSLFPSLNIVPGAFAMVGMAAVLAGAVHAPLTAILLLFEMTRDYRIILPLMFAVVISFLISRSSNPTRCTCWGWRARESASSADATSRCSSASPWTR